MALIYESDLKKQIKEKNMSNCYLFYGNEDYLRDIIRYDYLRFNKKRGIPEFIKYKVSKEVEEKIKEKYRDKYSFREYSIEKFNIDVEEYIKIKWFIIFINKKT